MIHNDYIMIIPTRSLLSNQKTFKPVFCIFDSFRIATRQGI